MGWNPTTEQILNLDTVRRRVDGFEYDLCDRYHRKIGDLHPDRDRSRQTLQNDTGSKTSRSLSGFRLLTDEAADVNPLTDRLRVYMRLQNGARFRLATLMWANDDEPIRPWGAELQSQLTDRTFILDQKSTRVYSWGRGASIMLIMFFLLFEAGIELKDIAVIGSEADRGLADPKSWEPGTTWMQMLLDLCALVGFAAPWFDRDGRVHIDVIPDPQVDTPTVEAYGDNTRVIAESVVRSRSTVTAPNDFAVYDSGTDRFRLGRVQVPASADHSFANRGFRIGEVEAVQGLESQAQADRSARNLARSKGVAYERITFDSTADPRHETHDIVPAWGFRWLETGWSWDLVSGGAMNHSLQRPIFEVR